MGLLTTFAGWLKSSFYRANAELHLLHAQRDYNYALQGKVYTPSYNDDFGDMRGFDVPPEWSSFDTDSPQGREYIESKRTALEKARRQCEAFSGGADGGEGHEAYTTSAPT